MEGVPGYELLANILTDAFEQSAKGKGRERHGLGDPWDEQPIITLGREFGIGGTNFQAAKKMREAQKMAERGEFGAAERELLGSIVYAAASIALVREAAEKRNSNVDSETLLKTLESVKVAEEPNPIPTGVYWDSSSDIFRNKDAVLMNVSFRQTWYECRDEFPSWSSRPL